MLTVFPSRSPQTNLSDTVVANAVSAEASCCDSVMRMMRIMRLQIASVLAFRTLTSAIAAVSGLSDA